MRPEIQVSLATALALTVHFGCRRDPKPDLDRAGTTRTTSASADSIPLGSGADRMLAAHCNHRQLCKEFGYPTTRDVDGCISSSASLLERTRASCGSGMRRSALEGCLHAIREASCSTVAEDFDRLPPCRTSELCGEVEQQ